MKRLTYLLVGAVLAAGLGFVLTHLGDYPWLMQTWYFTLLAYFVAFNTLAYATLAAVKMGWQSAQRHKHRPAQD